MSIPIVITAGGTGGHLFPAQALAEELEKRCHETVLITDSRGMKWRDAFPKTKLYKTLSATTARSGLLAQIGALFKLGIGTLQALRLLMRHRPKVVIGFGGYPSLPTMFASVLSGKPTCLHEQNGVMGRANKLVAPRMKGIALTFPEPKGMKKSLLTRSRVTGNPVRGNVIEASAIEYPELSDTSPINLVIFGGSQGAQIFSELVPHAVARLPENIKSRLNIVQQCREDDLEGARKTYSDAGIQVELATFYNNLPEILSMAHLIICRSGASTVCELTVLGRPAILVPLPGALDQDQAANAQFLVDAKGGWLLPQAEMTEEGLSAQLAELFSHPEELKRAAIAAKSVGKPNAVQSLADYVEQIAGVTPKGGEA